MKPEPKSKGRGWCWWLLVLVFAALVVSASLLTLWRNLHRSRSGSGSRDNHAPVDKYAAALRIALQFLEVQRSGKLVNNRIHWRGDSGMQDGSEANLDLSKGLYDAGDTIKFGFPMAFTATILSWSILEYGHHMKTMNELEHAQDSLKWITDYLINAHPSDNVLYIQVGDPEIDHNCWERPEFMAEERPLTQINTTHPGTEVAAETAAAMASASLVFKKINSTYSKSLLKHAQQLFVFADTYRASYSISIPQVQTYYNSTGYGDELLWAASWLYLATADQSYLRYVSGQNGNAFANWGSPTWFTWDNKLAGAQVLLSRIGFFCAEGISTEENVGLQMYRRTAEAVMCMLLPVSPTSSSRRTDSGLIWVSPWDALQYPVASAFLAVLFGDYMIKSQISTLYCNGELYKPADLRNFAISQADYVLGNNPMEMSYLVGFGEKYPQFVHHRGASIPVNATTGCADGFKWLYSADPNPNTAFGALVGGPNLNETYVDYRNNSIQGDGI
ncbi:endoglucanase 10-like [Diospyros lotus]|uniref:endoglucanase 10-like n=1 Tax=Diospyros lotus TaxID=55363 RepID=UPI0022519B2A|nr:endoglucanase 10-like [Diospyros lotus]